MTKTLEAPPEYRPYKTVQPKQQDFLRDGAKYKLIGGAQFGGKSYACRMEAFRTCQAVPRIRGLVMRRSRGEAIKNFVDPILEETSIRDENGEIIGPYLKWKSSQNKIIFPNGSTIDIGFCDNEGDIEKYRGLPYDWILIEELTQWPFLWWRKIMTCLRTKNYRIRPFFFGSTNPGGIGHAWVKRLWIKREYIENENPDDYGMTRSGIYDNPIGMAEDPEYLPSLQSLPTKERRARLDGDWDVFEGQFFDEWRHDIHVVRPFVPMQGVRKRIICLDYGYSPHPSAVYWLAQLNSGHVIKYRELVETKLRYDQLAARCAALTGEGEEINAVVADPSVASKESEDGNTFDAAFKAVGLTVVPGNNARIEGWNLMHKYLSPFEDPNTGRLVSWLTVTENCPVFINNIAEQIHDTVHVEDMNTKGFDHPFDACRYGLMYLGDILPAESGFAALNEPMKKTSLAQPKREQGEAGHRNESKEDYYRRQYGSDRDGGSRSILDERF